MSVLIKGMQMPKNCAECPVALSGKYCRINQTYTTYIELPIRPDHCPLIELPEHHGDLIDRDTIEKAVLKWMPPDPCGREEKEFPFETDICVSMMMEIEEQDTVIEAEGAEEWRK